MDFKVEDSNPEIKLKIRLYSFLNRLHLNMSVISSLEMYIYDVRVVPGVPTAFGLKMS